MKKIYSLILSCAMIIAFSSVSFANERANTSGPPETVIQSQNFTSDNQAVAYVYIDDVQTQIAINAVDSNIFATDVFKHQSFVLPFKNQGEVVDVGKVNINTTNYNYSWCQNNFNLTNKIKDKHFNIQTFSDRTVNSANYKAPRDCLSSI